MRKFVALNCLTDHNDSGSFPSDEVHSLRRAVLAPALYKPFIQHSLHSNNLNFHRNCSFANLIGECNVGEGQTLLMFWGCDPSESRGTMSMSVSSCSSLQQQNAHKELRTAAQQTEISCRLTSGVTSPGLTELEERVMRTRIADSLTFPSPASSLVTHDSNARSMSILGSVCALLLNHKQQVAAKPVPSFTGSVSDNICRICFGGASSERLVRPCSCRGTIAAVHRSCLERWLLQASTSYCELCRHHYMVTRTHKWSWWRSLVEWAVSGRGRALATDAWRGLVLALSSLLGTARALHACDAVLQAGQRHGGGAALAANLISSVIIGIIGALNGLLTTWMLLKIQEHQLSWQAWRDSTLHLHVTLQSDEPEPCEDPPLSRRSDVTMVATDGDTIDRSTNVADPFMVALPYFLSDL